MIYEINPDDGQIINSFPTPVLTSDEPTGLAFSGEDLYFTDAFTDYFIYVINPENGNVINTFPAPSTSSDGLAYIDPYLYVSDYNYGYIYVLNPLNGTLIDILYPPVYIGYGLVGGKDRLFATDFYIIYELNPQNGALINSFNTVNPVYGIGYTGKRLFSSIPWAGMTIPFSSIVTMAAPIDSQANRVREDVFMAVRKPKGTPAAGWPPSRIPETDVGVPRYTGRGLLAAAVPIQ